MILFRSNIKALEKVRTSLIKRVDHIGWNSQIHLNIVNQIELNHAITYVETAINKLKLIT